MHRSFCVLCNFLNFVFCGLWRVGYPVAFAPLCWLLGTCSRYLRFPAAARALQRSCGLQSSRRLGRRCSRRYTYRTRAPRSSRRPARAHKRATCTRQRGGRSGRARVSFSRRPGRARVARATSCCSRRRERTPSPACARTRACKHIRNPHEAPVVALEQLHVPVDVVEAHGAQLGKFRGPLLGPTKRGDRKTR